MTSIQINNSEVLVAMNDIQNFLNDMSLKAFHQRVKNRLFSLFDGGASKGSILFLSATTIADDHIISLGIGGDFKLIVSAIRAGKFDSIL